jgi:hypothetical protein
MPMSNVLIKAKAFTDERFAMLAHYLGLDDADQALLRCARLWSVCAITQHYTLSQLRVVAVLGDRGVEALVRCELAELVPCHLPTQYAAACGTTPTPAGEGELVVRMRGTEKTIERQGRQILAASGGGKKRAKNYEQLRAAAAAAQQPVDNAVKKLSDSDPETFAVVHSRVPMGNPAGTPMGMPAAQLSDARASDPRSPDLRDQNQRRPARSATPGLRVINGGADDAAEGGS